MLHDSASLGEPFHRCLPAPSMATGFLRNDGAAIDYWDPNLR